MKKYLIIKCSRYVRKVKLSEIHCIIYQDGQLIIEKDNKEKLYHWHPLKEIERNLPDSILNFTLYLIERFFGRETAIWTSKISEIEFD